MSDNQVERDVAEVLARGYAEVYRRHRLAPEEFAVVVLLTLAAAVPEARRRAAGAAPDLSVGPQVYRSRA